MAVQMGATVFDLEEAELCYAPQYGAAKDAVNMVGMIAANAMRGDLPITHWDEMGREGALVLDVRTKGEVEREPISCGKHIPIDDLRAHLDELPRDQPIQVVCAVGIRAYNAISLLRQHGYRASLLSGGVSTWHWQHCWPKTKLTDTIGDAKNASWAKRGAANRSPS